VSPLTSPRRRRRSGSPRPPGTADGEGADRPRTGRRGRVGRRTSSPGRRDAGATLPLRQASANLIPGPGCTCALSLDQLRPEDGLIDWPRSTSCHGRAESPDARRGGETVFLCAEPRPSQSRARAAKAHEGSRAGSEAFRTDLTAKPESGGGRARGPKHDAWPRAVERRPHIAVIG
jgi:hypothetical protein